MTTPVMSQTRSSQPGEPTVRAMSAVTMKMPEPIIEPTTIIVASNRPSIAAQAAGAWGYVVASWFSCDVGDVPSAGRDYAGWRCAPRSLARTLWCRP